MIILVLNLGLKSVRCIAFAFDGAVVAQASRPICTLVSNERVEQDPEEWRASAWNVISEVTSTLGDRANRVRYITVTTSASCLVALDTRGRPLGNSLLVSDTRAVHEAEILNHTVEFQSVQAETGAKSSPDLMLPKIMWLAKHEPETFGGASRFVNAGDYLVAQLTGRYVTDPNNALKFHYGMCRRSYPQMLLESLGIDPSTLPEVVDIGTEIGPVLGSVAAELHLPRSASVVLTTYDALAAVTGTGAFDIGHAVDVSGTVTSFRAVTDHHLFDPLHRIYVTPHVGKNRWLAGGSTNLSGGIIEWLRQLVFDGNSDAYGLMEAAASDQPPCPGGLIFLPHLLGERVPIWNPDCRGVFFGLNRAHGKAQLVRAIFEGVAFSVRHIARVLEEFHVPIRSVAVSGGLSRLNVVSQIKADVLGVPVRKIENFESTAIGAALIALVGVGVFESYGEGFGRFCRLDRVYEPDGGRHRVYEEYFELYLKVYESLRGAYAARASLLANLQKEGVDELVLAENL
jgi:xylulokinase